MTTFGSGEDLSSDGKLLDTSVHYGADSDWGADSDGTSSESDTKIGKFIILELE